jgi:hypothetical protein
MNYQALGSLLGGLGSIYSGYMQGKLGRDMFNLEKNNLMYNRKQEEERLKGLGQIGSYYGTGSTADAIKV